MNAMFRVFVILFAVTAAAAAPVAGPADDVLRAATAAIRQKDVVRAGKLLAACEERSTDPGLVAFNRGVLDFEAEDYREAELNFLRCLEDRAIPADRRAAALYNRGVSLALRGEEEKTLRSAVACFEQCLDATAPEGPLARDARHNLELTKLLWARARAKQATPPTPNDHQEEPPPRPPTPMAEDSAMNPGAEAQPVPATPAATAQATQPQPAAGQPAATGQQTPGRSHLPVLDGAGQQLQHLSADDTAALLDVAESRLQKARKRNEQMRAGPERPNVRDW